MRKDRSEAHWNNVVTLRGEVRDKAVKEEAEKIAKETIAIETSSGENDMKKIVLFSILLCSALAPAPAADISFGIRIGPPPTARVYRAPARPGPGYVFINGYWFPQGRKYRWHNGYWTRPPFPGAVWVGPRYEGGMFFEGYWHGDRGRFDHDHRWDRDGNRDRDRFDRRR